MTTPRCCCCCGVLLLTAGTEDGEASRRTLGDADDSVAVEGGGVLRGAVGGRKALFRADAADFVVFVMLLLLLVLSAPPPLIALRKRRPPPPPGKYGVVSIVGWDRYGFSSAPASSSSLKACFVGRSGIGVTFGGAPLEGPNANGGRAPLRLPVTEVLALAPTVAPLALAPSLWVWLFVRRRGSREAPGGGAAAAAIVPGAAGSALR